MTEHKCKTLRKCLHFIVSAGIVLTAIAAHAQQDNNIIDSRDLIGQLTPVTGEVAIVNLSIPFKIGSADLTAQARDQLNQLGQALQSEALSLMDVGLFGHTDASGSAGYNLTLSDKRAQMVRDYLIEHFKIDPEKLTARGYGEERLLHPEAPLAAENRRVEVVTTRPITGTPPPEGDTQAIN
ncbi:OmpA family protein [Aestuariispira insulae]|uniref:OmpA family protein n=1 Tax=Aestuariispira insulae TaxID=1461337 RepID=A0A3D9HVL4_9PROT|nr:OmpA family protein [Aestuariispira insulae]RED53553.1 OmpA family protein [Aestuariispira insulae]